MGGFWLLFWSLLLWWWFLWNSLLAGEGSQIINFMTTKHKFFLAVHKIMDKKQPKFNAWTAQSLTNSVWGCKLWKKEINCRKVANP